MLNSKKRIIQNVCVMDRDAFFVTPSVSSSWLLQRQRGLCRRCSCWSDRFVVRSRKKTIVITAEIMETKEKEKTVWSVDSSRDVDGNNARAEVISVENDVVSKDIAVENGGKIIDDDGAGEEGNDIVMEVINGKSEKDRFIRTVVLSILATAGITVLLGKDRIDLFIDGLVNGPHLVIAAAIGLSAFIQALTGFGFAMVAVGALSQVEWIANSSVFNDLQPVAAVFGSVIGWFLIFPEIRKVKWKELLPLIVTTALFTPIGALGIQALGESITLKVLGTLITGYVGYAILGIKIPRVIGSKWGSLGMGALAGMFGGAFDIQGPPVVLYGDAAEWNAGNGDFRRNLLAILSVNGTLVILYDFFTGRLEDYYVLDFVGNSLPFVIVGVAFGRFLAARLDASGFKKIVLGLCAIMGIRLLLH